MHSIILAAVAGLAALLSGAPAGAAARLSVEGTQFVLEAEGRRLASEALVGAVFEVADGAGGVAEMRIDAVSPSVERADILLHALSVKTADGAWQPMCDADASGRRMSFPMQGRWEGRDFVADPDSWFLTCTSGSQAKCVLWGYGPWDTSPDGRGLTDLYRACQQMVRADYEGRGEPHTREGTIIDMADAFGLQNHETLDDPAFAFEAGWGVDGAVCVARTRWPDLISRDALLASSPHLGGACDQATALKKGALLFTRVKAR